MNELVITKRVKFLSMCRNFAKLSQKIEKIYRYINSKKHISMWAKVSHETKKHISMWVKTSHGTKHGLCKQIETKHGLCKQIETKHGLCNK